MAGTLTLEFTVTIHDPVPEHPAPDQPTNAEPEAAVAVRVTVAPL